MRVSLKTSLGWLVPLLYLALPNCSFPGHNFNNLEPGDPPRSGLLLCDIERRGTRRCATAQDVAMGIPLSQAAIALAQRRKSYIGLDYSPAAAEAGCAPGQPLAITFQCEFPDGCKECVNCGEVIGPGKEYSNQDLACAAKCTDQFGSYDSNTFRPNKPPAFDDLIFCLQNARASTNADDTCSDYYFQSACTAAGAPPDPTFLDILDPRRAPEPVEWRDPQGVSVSLSGTLRRTAPSTMDFDAGAASVQTISRGDGYVEFAAQPQGRARACGLSVGAATDLNPDTDPTLTGIGFAIRLSVNNELFIHEGGMEMGPFGLFQQGDRVRVAVTDNFDGTADIAYYLVPDCTGQSCATALLRAAGPAPYPFRVDASLRQVDGTLTNVRLVRIK